MKVKLTINLKNKKHIWPYPRDIYQCVVLIDEIVENTQRDPYPMMKSLVKNIENIDKVW